ncbi:MAG: hypothetical protein IPL35_00830 [Sphingobacteriales bacterium]|nr:hypothetical protein [Sphingobacteriales bacterium]
MLHHLHKLFIVQSNTYHIITQIVMVIITITISNVVITDHTGGIIWQ